MTRSFLACLGVLFVLAPAPSRADELTTARQQDLQEISHQVDVSVDDGVATYRVRRTFSNHGDRAEEVRLLLDLPGGAAATGLRIRARKRWYSGDLLEADDAAARYQELTSMGAWQPKDPALLQWEWADRLGLRVFPVLAGATSTVEYTLMAPVQYRDGKYLLSYPHAGDDGDPATQALAQPVVSVHPGHGDWRTGVWVDGRRVAPGTPVVLRPQPEAPWVGEGERPEGHSAVFSQVESKQEGEARWARVHVEIDHTYRSDLRLALVDPLGGHHEIETPSGSDNDIRGTFVVEVPQQPAQGAWHLQVSDTAGLDVGNLESWDVAFSDAETPSEDWKAGRGGGHTWSPADVPLHIPDAPAHEGDGGVALIEVTAPSIRTVASRLGRVVASDEVEFSRLALEVAPELRTLPKRASVVFVIDGSRSRDGLQPDLATLAAYLSHVPDATVEVVVYRRSAQRVFGEFVSSSSVHERLVEAQESGALDLGNGSALEAGLRLAARTLDAQRLRSPGPSRIVVLSDRRLRSRFENHMATRALGKAPNGTVAHIVTPQASGLAGVARRDDWALAPVAERTGGVAFEVRGTQEPLKALAAPVLALVRPVSIDGVTMSAVGVDPDALPEPPERLLEGQSFGYMKQVPDAPRRVVFRGRIWSRPWTHTVKTSATYDRATAGFVFSEDEYGGLSDDEQLKVAKFGRVVSPVTSYLAIEPGVRPSVDGLEHGSGAGFGGRGRRVARVRAARAGASPPPLPTIASLMPEGIKRCSELHHPAPGWNVELDVETTGVEIVDVIGRGKASALRACLVEEVWSVELPDEFARDVRELRRVVLG